MYQFQLGLNIVLVISCWIFVFTMKKKNGIFLKEEKMNVVCEQQLKYKKKHQEYIDQHNH